MHLKLKALLFVIIYECLNVSNIKIYVFTVKSLLSFFPYLKNIFSFKARTFHSVGMASSLLFLLFKQLLLCDFFSH